MSSFLNNRLVSQPDAPLTIVPRLDPASAMLAMRDLVKQCNTDLIACQDFLTLARTELSSCTEQHAIETVLPQLITWARQLHQYYQDATLIGWQLGQLDTEPQRALAQVASKIQVLTGADAIAIHGSDTSYRAGIYFGMTLKQRRAWTDAFLGVIKEGSSLICSKDARDFTVQKICPFPYLIYAKCPSSGWRVISMHSKQVDASSADKAQTFLDTVDWQTIARSFRSADHIDTNYRLLVVRHNTLMDALDLGKIDALWRLLLLPERYSSIASICGAVDNLARNISQIIRATRPYLHLLESQSCIKTTMKASDWQGLVEAYQPEAAAKGLVYCVRVANDLPTLPIDLPLFESVLNNVMGNAIKYTTIGSVTVSVKADVLKSRPCIRIDVQDSGIGIPEADLDKIGRPDFRATNVGDIAGTGIGINYVKKALKFLPGDIQITSIASSGTTVSLFLYLPIPGSPVS